MNPTVLKCVCPHCDVPIEYPHELAETTVDCPACQNPLLLISSPPTDATAPTPQESLSTPELLALFGGPVPRTRVSLFYRLGLLVVTVAMLLLPVFYLALIVTVAWGVWFWATHFSFLLASGGGGVRLWLIKLLLYVTPLFAGMILVFFMVKPLFARRPKGAQPLALNPGAEPMLFAFTAKICETVGAPFPKRVDLDCNLNAAASFRRGLWSLFGHDLVLTIGLPLVAGLNITQFAGVLAHEFGHFTQGFGMRLTYIIRSVNAWFARVVYERDAWDVMLEEWADTEDGRIAFLVGCARFAVWCSRLVLKLLMYIGHGIGCFMLRQMEFDADSYEVKVAGSTAFEEAMRRFHVLGHVTEMSYKQMRVGWNQSRELPDNLPAYLLSLDQTLHDSQRTQIEDRMGLEATGLFDTHPSNGDRIRAARRAADSGIFRCDLPATTLFNNFDVPAKQVTMLHYDDDLGIPLAQAKLVKLQPPETPTVEMAPEETSNRTMSSSGLRLRGK